MIRIREGALSYGEETILSDLILDIKTGEFVVVCGESGCGKSSFIRVLNGLIPELYEGETTGEFVVNGENLPTTSFSDYVKEIGVVFQNPKTQFFMNDVYSELAFSMENYGIERSEMIQRIDEMAEAFDLKAYYEKSMHELSGGEKQRIAFASSGMIEHDLFLLDEPSSNLDETHIQLIKKYLIWLKEKGHTIIVAEHRLYYLMEMADRFLFMKEGKVAKIFTKEELLELSQHEITALGLRSLTRPVLNLATKEKEVEAHQVNFLTSETLSFKYKNSQESLMFGATEFTSNQVVGIVGENGAGKTTFSQLLTGILKPSTGQVSFNGKKQTPKQLMKQSFLVRQDVNLQLFFETVEKEITGKAKRMDLFDLVVETLQLGDLLDRHPQTLSGGQKQRVAIASGILSGKDVMIMDEPTSGLDLKHMLEVNDMIQQLRQYQVIVIIISHDREFLNLCCDEIIEIADN